MLVITQDRFRGALDQSLDQSPPSLLPLTSLLYLGHTEAGLPADGRQEAPPVQVLVEVQISQPADSGLGSDTINAGAGFHHDLRLSHQCHHLGRSRLLGQFLKKIK